MSSVSTYCHGWKSRHGCYGDSKRWESMFEHRYAQQIDQLTSDLTLQWDLTSKLQLELEKQRRSESDMRRELQQKSCTVDELKKELQTKIGESQHIRFTEGDD